MATESYTAAVDPIRNLLLGLVAGQQCMPQSLVVMSILPTHKGQFSRAFQVHHAISSKSYKEKEFQKKTTNKRTQSMTFGKAIPDSPRFSTLTQRSKTFVALQEHGYAYCYSSKMRSRYWKLHLTQLTRMNLDSFS